MIVNPASETAAPKSARLHLADIFRWAILAFYAFTSLHYLASPISTDHGEPTIIAIAANYLNGHPIYHALESGPRYTMIYGPWTFLLPAASLWLFGRAIWAAKLPFTLASLLSPVLMYRQFRSRCPRHESLALVSALLALELIFSLHAYWTRPEPFLVLSVALSLMAMRIERPLLRGLCLGLIVGFAANLKIIAPLLFIPVFFLRWDKDSIRVAGVAALASIAFLGVPFLLPGVSFHDYWTWVSLHKAKGIVPGLLYRFFFWGALCLIPFEWARQELKLGTGSLKSLQRAYVLAVLVSAGLLWYCSAKPGAEAHYFLPLLPTGFYVLGSAMGRKPDALRRWGTALLILSLVGILTFLARGFEDGIPTDPRGPAIVTDLKKILAKNPGVTVAVGIGEREGLLTRFRTIPVLAGNPFLLDDPNLIDAVVSGLQLPPATYEMIARCEAGLWLIPRGEKPFAMKSLLSDDSLFTEGFREDFHQHYRKVGESAFYDLWVCR